MYVDPLKIIPKPQQIELKNKQEHKLVGWMMKSEKEIKNSPILLFFHGNGENISSHFTGLYWILEKGYSYLIFDYPGYGGSDGAATQENAVEAGELFYEYIKATYPDRDVVMFGQSLGGQIAMKTTLNKKSEDKIRLVVVESTFPKYSEMAKLVVWRKWWSRWLYPFAPILISDNYSPNEEIGNISPIPLIVIHGEKDQVVEYEMGQKVFEYAKEPKEFWSVPNGQHIDTFVAKEHEAFRDKLLQALKKYASPKKSEKTNKK